MIKRPGIRFLILNSYVLNVFYSWSLEQNAPRRSSVVRRTQMELTNRNQVDNKEESGGGKTSSVLLNFLYSIEKIHLLVNT